MASARVLLVLLVLAEEGNSTAELRRYTCDDLWKLYATFKLLVLLLLVVVVLSLAPAFAPAALVPPSDEEEEGVYRKVHREIILVTYNKNI